MASPSPSVLAGVRQALLPHAPFASMSEADLDRLVRASTVRYYAAGEVIVAPGGGRPRYCHVIRQGTVRAIAPVSAPGSEPAMRGERGAGEMFPLSALLQHRSVTSIYQAVQDTFVISFPAAVFDKLLAHSATFADFCRRRVEHLVELSRASVQAEFAVDQSEQRGSSTPLANLVRHAPVVAAATTPIGEALRMMEARRIGSIVLVDAARRPTAIFTRQDVIGRIVLAQRPLDAPLSEVATAPVITLPREATAGDAAVEMARRGIRHIAVVDETGRTAGVVSERDLFALQRLSAREVSSDIRRAPDVDALAQRAQDIRALASALVAQGVASSQLTRMISSLNDQLLQRLVELVVARHDLAGLAVCWIGMGSEGRSEQTIATDQDNGVIFEAAEAPQGAEAARERLLPFAREVNEALDRCGYPLCKGGVMAMNPKWCASLGEWRDQFHQWIDRGDPESLLASSIFFDFRSLWGEARLAHVLRDDIAKRAQSNPRFLKQMADNALAHGPPLNWFGELSPLEDESGISGIDLKLQGTALFVDGARILALASGVTATSTAERLAGAGEALRIPPEETRAWTESFEYLQLLRLRTQHRRAKGTLARAANANLVPLDDLSELDRRVVKESMRQARRLQQRLALDYPG
jgi:CBS domain-containing protein